MITITERKIAGLTPRWAPFPGFSLLFDAPGGSFQAGEGVETLAYDPAADSGPEFYRRIEAGFRSLNPDRLLQTYGLCALPPASYHVTAFDVANVDDLSRCRASFRDELKTLLDRLPDPTAFGHELLEQAQAFAREERNLSFRFDRLRISGTMVVVLKPVDEAAYAKYLGARAALSRGYRNEYGVGASESYTPHLSLGYFTSRENSECALAREKDWDAILRESVGDAVLTFPTASLYGFTDMATFFRWRDHLGFVN